MILHKCDSLWSDSLTLPSLSFQIASFCNCAATLPISFLDTQKTLIKLNMHQTRAYHMVPITPKKIVHCTPYTVQVSVTIVYKITPSDLINWVNDTSSKCVCVCVARGWRDFHKRFQIQITTCTLVDIRFHSTNSTPCAKHVLRCHVYTVCFCFNVGRK